MKKKLTSFLVCLLILIAFGGFVFFIGWTQFKIEPNNVGILICIHDYTLLMVFTSEFASFAC